MPRALLVAGLLSFFAVPCFVGAAGCGNSDDNAASPQTCMSANTKLASCGVTGEDFPTDGNCDDQTVCEARCVNNGTCAEVSSFYAGQGNDNAVGDCVGDCS